jgi:lactoylglutathione lyase
MREVLTQGVDHVGLTVSDLEASKNFFVDCLGWREVGGKPDYPSAFVSDGTTTLTLWQRVGDEPADFDRHNNVGLHHLALKVTTEVNLKKLFKAIKKWPGITIEFPPDYSGKGPKVHTMIIEPGGNRIEFAFDPR